MSKSKQRLRGRRGVGVGTQVAGWVTLEDGTSIPIRSKTVYGALVGRDTVIKSLRDLLGESNEQVTIHERTITRLRARRWVRAGEWFARLFRREVVS